MVSPEPLEPHRLARAHELLAATPGQRGEVTRVPLSKLGGLRASTELLQGVLPHRFEQREARLAVRTLRLAEQALLHERREAVEQLDAEF